MSFGLSFGLIGGLLWFRSRFRGPRRELAELALRLHLAAWDAATVSGVQDISRVPWKFASKRSRVLRLSPAPERFCEAGAAFTLQFPRFLLVSFQEAVVYLHRNAELGSRFQVTRIQLSDNALQRRAAPANLR